MEAQVKLLVGIRKKRIHHKDHKAAKAAHKEHKIKFLIKNFKGLRIVSVDKI